MLDLCFLSIFPVREKYRDKGVIHDQKIPNGNICSVEELGEIVRAQRKTQGATQAEFGSLCGVGVRFISELENGKPTIELGRVLKVLKCLGLEIRVQPRDWKSTE